MCILPATFKLGQSVRGVDDGKYRVFLTDATVSMFVLKSDEGSVVGEFQLTHSS